MKTRLIVKCRWRKHEFNYKVTYFKGKKYSLTQDERRSKLKQKCNKKKSHRSKSLKFNGHESVELASILDCKFYEINWPLILTCIVFISKSGCKRLCPVRRTGTARAARARCRPCCRRRRPRARPPCCTPPRTSAAAPVSACPARGDTRPRFFDQTSRRALAACMKKLTETIFRQSPTVTFVITTWTFFEILVFFDQIDTLCMWKVFSERENSDKVQVIVLMNCKSFD